MTICKHIFFQGNFPPEIGSLTSLEILDVEMNRFEGALPAALGSLIDLKVSFAIILSHISLETRMTNAHNKPLLFTSTAIEYCQELFRRSITTRNWQHARSERGHSQR